MESYDYYNKQHFRLKVLAGMCATFGSLAFILGLLNIFLSHRYIFGAAELLYAAYSFYLYKKSRTNQTKIIHKQVYIVSIALLIFIGSYAFPLETGMLLWSYTLPSIYYLLLGSKAGLSPTLLTLIAQVLIITNRGEQVVSFEPLHLTVNFSFCYMCVWAITHAYETNREKTETALKHLATKDPLTNTNNRLALKHAFEKYTQSPKTTKLFMLLLDVDHFKKINDKMGHEAGDEALIQLSALLRSISDCENVFRIGGEEFCIFLKENTLSEALSKSQHIKHQVQKLTVNINQQSIGITVSGGMCEYKFNMALSDALKQADDYLYQAKSNGRNCIIHAPEQIVKTSLSIVI